MLVGDQFDEEIIDLPEDEELELFLESLICQFDLIDELLGEVCDVEDDWVATVTQLTLEATPSDAGNLSFLDWTVHLHL